MIVAMFVLALLYIMLLAMSIVFGMSKYTTTASSLGLTSQLFGFGLAILAIVVFFQTL